MISSSLRCCHHLKKFHLKNDLVIKVFSSSSPENPRYNNNDYYNDKDNDEDTRVDSSAKYITNEFAAGHTNKQQKEPKK
jgi:hypothetical protein